MQEMIILGFIINGISTGYEIKKMMEMSTNSFFNSSLGSIYPAMRKLEEEKLVSISEQTDGGRLKKIYTPTGKGITTFEAWLDEDIQLSKPRMESLVRIFFFKHLPPEKRKEKLQNYIALIEELLQSLHSLDLFLAGKNIDYFVQQTLEFGKDYYQFKKDWFGNLLGKLKTETTE